MNKPENKKDKPVATIITVVSFLILGGGGLAFASGIDSQPVPAETVQAPVHSNTTGDSGADLNTEFNNSSSGGSLGK